MTCRFSRYSSSNGTMEPEKYNDILKIASHFCADGDVVAELLELCDDLLDPLEDVTIGRPRHP